MRVAMLYLVLCGLLSGAARAEDWTTFMRNLRRTGCVDDATGPAQARRVWRFRPEGEAQGFAASPAVAAGRVYIGCDDHNLYCLDANTGAVVWKFRAAAEVFAAPVVAAGRVYIGEGLHEYNNARLYCLDAKTGKVNWFFQTRSHVEFSPTLHDGKLYFGAGDDGLYCVDAQSGRLVWQFKNVHVDMCPAVNDAGVFFGNVYGKPAFYRVNARTGELIWSMPAELEVCGSPSIDGGRVYFGLGNGTFAMSHAQPKGAVCCLSADDGKAQWTFRPKDTVLTCIAIEDGAAYFGSRDGTFYCVDAATGKGRWASRIGEAIISSPAITAGRAYFGCDDGAVYCLDASSGKKLWAYDTSREAFNVDVRVISSPAIYGGRLFVGSMNSHFLCLGEK